MFGLGFSLGAQYVKRLNIKQLLPPVEMQDRSSQNDDDYADDEEENESTNNADAEIKKALSDHFDFTQLIKRLPNLEELHLVYGVKTCGMNFEWTMFEFTKKDCQLLAKSIQQCKSLRVLHLHRSKVDDLKIRMLIRDGLLDHPTLEELNLEHNQISDRKFSTSSHKSRRNRRGSCAWDW
jgi:Leucine-rich repeat (LRR) protein